MAAEGAPLDRGTGIALPQADSRMIGKIRLLFAGTALLTHVIQSEDSAFPPGASLSALIAYTVYSLTFLATARGLPELLRGKRAVWLDVAWYALLTALTGPLFSSLFLCFLFPILVASFRHHSREGLRVTMAAVALFVVLALLVEPKGPDFEWDRLLLRTVVLLTLGLMIITWAGSEAAFRRRLALLHEISLLSNPRFGVDQTIASVMEKLRLHFRADMCMVVEHDNEQDSYSLRQSDHTQAAQALRSQSMPADAARLLLPFDPAHVVVFHGSRRFWPRRTRSYVFDPAADAWANDDRDLGNGVASILGTEAFISAPLHLRKGAGRIYLASGSKTFSPEDALFLNQVGTQAYSMIDSIGVLDRLASEAAGQERQRIVRDLHDSTIQPYIGLRLALDALHQKAAPDNPLAPHIYRLAQMTASVIGDLRENVAEIRTGAAPAEGALLSGVQRQAARFRDFYGIGIDVHADGEVHVSDRLAAEVLQIVNEGLSNIRKHTTARQGAVTLSCNDGFLRLQIRNEESAQPAPAFTPRSIAERALALGGRAWVDLGAGSATTVNIRIPV